MMTSAEIRQHFLDFFRSKGHAIVPSAPIVVKDDPTLMFTNAGMNQFKAYFLGEKEPPNRRVADTQKCLRVSGKHNDLEEVGVDTYHHTMFEMLGNWSFGDYFKVEAIAWSWELLTDVLGIPQDRLYASVFEGDEKEGLPPSSIALTEWKKILPDNRIVFGKKKDNFWEMGDTGPCGPCSEIHVDLRPDAERALIPGEQLVNKDHPQVIEIWNNVFIQYNRVWADKKGYDAWIAANKDATKEEKAKKTVEFTKLESLPASHVDTGMGFERLVRVIQNKRSNYDTDVFTGTIAATEKNCGLQYTGGDDKQSVAFRVIADHIRAIGFTIADGQLPSNNGAGYVIRRILRRAVRYYYSYLNYKHPLLCQLMPVLGKQFENVFPELQQQIDFVCKVVKEEEEAFLRTLEKGLKRIDEALTNAADGLLDGKSAFELHDTYGFPIDLTELIAHERNMKVDVDGYNKARTEQQERGRAATSLDTGDWTILNDSDSNRFVGYDTLTAATHVQRYRKVTAKGKTQYQVVLAETPFYAESGGQVGDSGTLTIGETSISITDTKKENNLIIHFADALPEDLSGEVRAQVDATRRHAITVHHSVTHLMHSALRQVLGTHVAQKGSLVNAEHLRFDFSHFAKVTEEEIAAVEAMVNQKIRENVPVVIKEMDKDEAVAMGAMALFGEKYGDKVRVVVMDPAYSIELCGGTHVGSTGELGLFKIKHESAVAAGVRRVEALCGQAAESYVNEQFATVHMVKGLLKNTKDIQKSIENLLEENSKLHKKLEGLEARQLVGIRNQLLQQDEIVNGVNFVADIIEVGNPEALKKLCADLKTNLNDYVAVLCSNIDGKAHVAIGISDTVAAAKGLDAVKIIKEKVAGLIKGGGGGQATLASAGGQEVGKLSEVIAVVKGLL